MTHHDHETAAGPWLPDTAQDYHSALRRLLAEPYQRERKRICSALTGAFAPDDLLHALSKADRSHASRMLGRLTRRKSRGVERWIHQAHNALARWSDRGAWSASAQSDNMVLFRSKGVAKKTLVVGFTGRSNWLMLPTYRVLQALGPDDYDLLLLRDPNDQFYQVGIPELGDTPHKTANSLAQWIEAAGYTDTIAMGTSAGHLAALYTTLTNGWRHAMLVGGAEPGDVPTFEKLLSETRHDPAISLHHCYAAGHAGNARSAQALLILFGETRLFPYSGVGTHNLLEAIDANADAVSYIRLHLCTPEKA